MSNLLIVDDHTIIRTGLKLLIKHSIPGTNIDEANDGKSSYEKIINKNYDLVIMDVNMPGTDSFELVQKILSVKTGTKILMFSMNDEEIYAKRYLRLGVLGYLGKDSSEIQIIDAINSILNGTELKKIILRERNKDKKQAGLKVALFSSRSELKQEKQILIEQITKIIVQMIHSAGELPKTNFSDYLSKILNYDYNYLSNLFTELKGMTIEQYIILHKIEFAKELLIYNELTLTEIAYKLHYSSVSHLSNQFKKVTGLTPSFFKKMRHNRTFHHANV